MDSFVQKVNNLSRERSIKSLSNMNKDKEYWYSQVPQEIKDKGLIESNTLIAKFMGYESDDSNKFFYGIHYYIMDADSNKTYDQLTIENVRSHTTLGFVYNYKDMIERRYDNHWDMLMPVVKKCCDDLRAMGFDRRGSYKPELGYVSDIFLMRLDNPIEKVYQEVINHIKRFKK